MADKDRGKEFAQNLPGTQVLGTIDPSTLTDPKPKAAEWTSEDGTQFSLTEPPPPWEVGNSHYTMSDARQFVEVPENWKLRWINPRLLDSEGWRDWQALSASDPRVKVKVRTMVTPENYIRRGGPQGDILCWMWQGWYVSKQQQLTVKTRELTQSAVERQEQLKYEFARGTYGPNVKLEEAKHPTHTMAEGQSLKKDL